MTHMAEQGMEETGDEDAGEQGWRRAQQPAVRSVQDPVQVQRSVWASELRAGLGG